MADLAKKKKSTTVKSSSSNRKRRFIWKNEEAVAEFSKLSTTDAYNLKRFYGVFGTIDTDESKSDTFPVVWQCSPNGDPLARKIYLVELSNKIYAGPFSDTQPFSQSFSQASFKMSLSISSNRLPTIRLIPTTVLMDDSDSFYNVWTGGNRYQLGLANLFHKSQLPPILQKATRVKVSLERMTDDSFGMHKRRRLLQPEILQKNIGDETPITTSTTTWKIRALPPVKGALINYGLLTGSDGSTDQPYSFVDLVEAASLCPSTIHFWCLDVKWSNLKSGFWLARGYLRGVVEVEPGTQKFKAYAWLPNSEKAEVDTIFTIKHPALWLALVGAEPWYQAIDSFTLKYPALRSPIGYSATPIKRNQIFKLKKTLAANAENIELVLDGVARNMLLIKQKELSKEVEEIYSNWKAKYNSMMVSGDRIAMSNQSLGMISDKIKQAEAALISTVSSINPLLLHPMLRVMEIADEARLDDVHFLTGQILKLKMQYSAIKEDYDSAIEHNKQLITKLKREEDGAQLLEKEIDQLNEENKRLIANIDLMLQTVVGDSVERAELKEEIKKIKEQFQTIVTTKEDEQKLAIEEARKLKDELARTKFDYENVRKQQGELEGKLVKLKADYENALKIELDKNTVNAMQIRDLTGKLKSISRQLENTQKEVVDGKKREMEMNEIVKRIRLVLTESQKLIEENKQRDNEYNKTLETIIQPIVTILDDKDGNLKRKYEASKGKIRSLSILAVEFTSRLVRSREAFKDQNRELVKELTSLKETHSKLKATSSEQENTIKSLIDELEVASTGVGVLESQADELRYRLDEQTYKIGQLAKKYIDWADSSLYPREVSFRAMSARPFMINKFGHGKKNQYPSSQLNVMNITRRWMTVYKILGEDIKALADEHSSPARKMEYFASKVLNQSNRKVLQINLNSKVGLPIYFKYGSRFIKPNTMTTELRTYFPELIRIIERSNEKGVAPPSSPPKIDWEYTSKLGIVDWTVKIASTEDSKEADDKIRPVIMAWVAPLKSTKFGHTLKPHGFFTCLNGNRKEGGDEITIELGIPLVGAIVFDDFPPYGSGGTLAYDLNEKALAATSSGKSEENWRITGYFPSSRVIIDLVYRRKFTTIHPTVVIIRISLEPFTNTDKV